ncbi:MAG: hypothetical protein RLZ71_273 [Actinomycetota bacterium]|jgi:hypothetical protein
MGQIGCGTIIVLILMAYGISTHPEWWPYIIAFLVAMAGLITWMVIAGRRKSQRDLEASLLSQADALEHLAKNGFSKSADFVLQKDEKFIYEISSVDLTEYKSSGSTYQGGSVGASAPIGFGGIRVGGSRRSGTITRNPEQLTVVDSGAAVYTTKRVIFTGERQTRNFDLAKVVNYNPGPNGITVSIPVTNRSATSGLQQTDMLAISPGILMDIAMTAAADSEKEALNKVAAYAEALRNTVAEQRARKR